MDELNALSPLDGHYADVTMPLSGYFFMDILVDILVMEGTHLKLSSLIISANDIKDFGKEQLQLYIIGML